MVRGSKQLLTAAMLAVSIFAVSINANDNVYNVSALYEKKSTLKGKTVKVKGTVLKITRAIMRKDWITISDNSSFQGKDNIIFTSTSAAAQNLKIGDKVTAEGILELDLDLGFPGYQYPVIVQNSKFSK